MRFRAINRLGGMVPAPFHAGRGFFDYRSRFRIKQEGWLPFKNNCFAVMKSGSEEGSYLRLVDFCTTQL